MDSMMEPTMDRIDMLGSGLKPITSSKHVSPGYTTPNPVAGIAPNQNARCTILLNFSAFFLFRFFRSHNPNVMVLDKNASQAIICRNMVNISNLSY
jgi:hypothetical protein